MATYKPSKNIDSTKATYGESSAGVKALQTQLNESNKGVAGYTPLKVDGLYGPLTKAATNFKATTNGNNPIVSSTNVRGEISSLGNDINTLKTNAGLNVQTPQGYDGSSIINTAKEMQALLQQEQQRQKQLYESDTAGIRSSYEGASRLQEERQNKAYAGRATGLVTSGGGFLGTTQSQQGVLQDLRNTHEQERQALMSKRDAALQASSNAYSEKNFAYATQQLKIAKDTEQEIYNRQKDFADQSLALAKENRAQTEFDIGLADKKTQAYAQMSDEEFKTVPQSEINTIDSIFYSGYTADKRQIEKKAMDAKSLQDEVGLQNDVYTLLNKIPSSKTITLGGVTFQGLDTSGGKSSSRKLTTTDIQKINNVYSLDLPLVGTTEEDARIAIEESQSSGPQDATTLNESYFMNKQNFSRNELWKVAIGSGIERKKNLSKEDEIDLFIEGLPNKIKELKNEGLDDKKIIQYFDNLKQ